MTLPMVDGPKDGDFARYVEQLAHGAPAQPAAPSSLPAEAVQAKLEAAALAVVRGRSLGAAKKGAPAPGGSPGMRFKLQLWAAAAMMMLVVVLAPRLSGPVLIFVGLWLVSALIRWVAAAAGRSSHTDSHSIV